MIFLDMDDFFETVKQRFHVLDDIWEDAGCNSKSKKDRSLKTQKYLLSTLDQIVAEEKKNVESIKEQLKKFSDELVTLADDLNVEIPDLEKHKNIMKRLTVLQNIVMDLKLKREDMLQRFNEVWDSYQSICRLLDSPCDKKPVAPKEIHIEEFHSKICDMRSIEIERKLKRDTLLEKINEYNNISMNPITLSFDLSILSENVLYKLEEVKRGLELQLQVQKDEISEMKSKILSLSRRIANEKEIQKWMPEGYSKAVYEKLHSKLIALETQRKENLPKFIQTLKDELVSYWDICYVSREEQDEFKFPDDVSEETVSVIECEIERLKRFHKEAKPIFDLYNHWEKLKFEHRNLELQAKDPSRLKNRGGALLKESRRKNYLLKVIPETEKNLRYEALCWYNKHNEPLTIYGKTVDDWLLEELTRKQDIKAQDKTNRVLRNTQNLTIKSPRKVNLTSRKLRNETKLIAPSLPELNETMIIRHCNSSSSSISTISSLTNFQDDIEAKCKQETVRSSTKYKRRRSRSAEPGTRTRLYCQKSPGSNRTGLRTPTSSRTLKSPKSTTRFTPYPPFKI